jgi:hypothetical protein
VGSKKRPLFLLFIKPKDGSKNWTRAGAVFDNEFNMSLVLAPGIVLDGALQKEHYFNLDPYDPERHDIRRRSEEKEKPPEGQEEHPPSEDDDIPF